VELLQQIGWTSLRIAGLVLLDLVLLAGLLAIPLGLSGNFIILGAGLVAALISRFSMVTIAGLVVMGVFVALGELVESLLGSVVARKYGASKWGMIGAFAGGILGAAAGTPIFPVVGTVIGSFVGTAAGALIAELLRGSPTDEGTMAGFGALVGRTLASAFKMAVGMAMVVYIVYRTHGGAP